MEEYIQWYENHLQAVYDEINAQRPDIVRHADTSRRSQKYRHDENVIASTPAMYRQVVVPAPGVKEYVTGKDLIAFARSLRNEGYIGCSWAFLSE
jgi:enhancer of mRNA-decapping protein 3